MKKQDKIRVMNVAIETGQIMLTNGAETYRVEETIKRMAESRGLKNVNVFVIPTGIMISCQINDETYSRLIRINPSSIDLEVIDQSNAFSRLFTTTDMPIHTAEQYLKSLEGLPKFSNRTYYFFGALAGSFFVLLFGGTLTEFFLTYFASLATLFVLSRLNSKVFNFFIKNVIGGIAGSSIALLLVLLAQSFGFTAYFDKVVIGPLMTMVPGVALTNGIRDLISGELLAGNAKMTEALFVAIALAFGVGIVLQFALKLST